MFIITDKTKTSREGGKRCRCYERRRAKLEEIEDSHTKPMNLCAYENEDHEDGVGVGVNSTLMSDTL